MNLIEAKVEAATFSRLTGKTVYIVQNSKEADDFYIGTNEVDDAKRAVTFYRDGCEKGEGRYLYAKGFNRATSDSDNPKPRKRKSADDLIDGLGAPKEKKPRAVVPADLPTKKFDAVKEAAKSTDSCKAEIKGKIWVVSVKGSWAIQQSVMDMCEGGLILVIRGQGWYNYPKSMWTEFKSIFESGTYKGGKPYSQSILPKKFDKYFTKY